ncbi:MAG: sugar phosphate isomerase/epimerase [Eubacteriales bacterium]|nr:sugar phosphate isomerase/epimerase [Eubacteriales bacterium]
MIGMSSSNYYGRFTNEESIEHLCRLGVRDFEVFLQSSSEYTDEFADLLLHVAEPYGARFHSLHSVGTQFEPQLFATADRQRADAIKVFEQLMRCAERMGIGIYVMHGPARLKRKLYRLDYPLLGKRAAALCRIAADHGVTLTWENVHWAYYYRPDFAPRLLEYCPDIAFTMDIKQAMQADHTIFEYLDALPPEKIVNVHVCDYDRGGNLLLPGKGIFDFEKLFAYLRRIGYGGEVVEEVYAGQITDDEILMESFRYLQKLDAQTEE